MRPGILTFDIFGTVLDWRRGLSDALVRYGVNLAPIDFDRVIDRQAAMESGRYRPYEAILASSLVEVLGIDPAAARSIGARAGGWPLFEDSRLGLARLMRVAPCVAITNSDERHRKQVEEALGFHLSDWISAESARRYKPDPGFWALVAARRRAAPGRDWWHVSAYADYDLETARGLGLTRVFVDRSHSRPGPADHRVHDLVELARRLESDPPPRGRT
jgi:2-haloacid dehalogenase